MGNKWLQFIEVVFANLFLFVFSDWRGKYFGLHIGRHFTMRWHRESFVVHWYRVALWTALMCEDNLWMVVSYSKPTSDVCRMWSFSKVWDLAWTHLENLEIHRHCEWVSKADSKVPLCIRAQQSASMSEGTPKGLPLSVHIKVLPYFCALWSAFPCVTVLPSIVRFGLNIQSLPLICDVIALRIGSFNRRVARYENGWMDTILDKSRQASCRACYYFQAIAC